MMRMHGLISIIVFSSRILVLEAQEFCDISITKEKIDFGGCYSGLTINELTIFDTAINSYPKNFKKKNAIVLIENPNMTNTMKRSTVMMMMMHILLFPMLIVKS
jgi:hypothetical protein